MLVFALRQQRYGDATADLLQLVGTLDGLADGHENIPHPPPVLQLGAKLSGRKTKKRERTDVSNRTERPRLRQEAHLDFHHSVSHIQVAQTGGGGSCSLMTKTESLGHSGSGLLPAASGSNELHLLAGVGVCTDGGLDVTIVRETVHPVKAQHEARCSHLPADKQTVTCTPTATELLRAGVGVP